jgi:RND family efflux transporter MFP subunit
MQEEVFSRLRRWQDMGVPSLSFLPRHLFVGIFLAAFSVAFIGGCEQKKEAPVAAAPPPEVEVTNVLQKDVPIYSEWVGTTDGLVNAKIRAQVTGYLAKQDYKEGSQVKKGDLLFEIDPRPFKAALDQAEAQLAQAKAKLGKTELDVKRYTPLARESAISQQELDDAIQANLAAKAGVESAQATVEQARLNLSFTRITSPIDGIAGTANAQIGDLVGPSQIGELTTVSTVNPIKVYFPISEQEYMEAARDMAKAGRSLNEPAKTDLELILADGSVFPQKGTFSFAERQVDVKTGTIRVAALFPNPGDILRPGQFARVRALRQVKKDALLIPQRAVTELQGKFLVAVVGADNKVSIRPVKAANRVDSLWVIDEGLKPGDRVVVEGVQKVKEGQAVNPKVVEAESQTTPTSSPKPEAKPASTPTTKKE